MTRKEFMNISCLLKSVFTSPSFMPDNVSMETWYRALSDIDGKYVSMAVSQYIMTEEKQPLPATIRKRALALCCEKDLNVNEAWSLVRKAISDSCYHSVERFNELPEPVKKAVGSPENLRSWALDDHFNEGVIQSHFATVYKTELVRKNEIATLPAEMREAFLKLQTSGVLQIGENNES